MAGYQYVCNKTVLGNYAFFSLQVLYAPWLPELYFCKNRAYYILIFMVNIFPYQERQRALHPLYHCLGFDGEFPN